MEQKEKFMKLALKEADKAYKKLEIPIGAVIVKDNKVIARGFNRREGKMDSTCHAEIIAIKKACQKLGNWRLSDCDIYVTLEPCPMCAGAILNSRINKLYYGAYDNKSGAVNSRFNLLDEEVLNHKVKYEGEVLKEDCEHILKTFFKEIRNKI